MVLGVSLNPKPLWRTDGGVGTPQRRPFVLAADRPRAEERGPPLLAEWGLSGTSGNQALLLSSLVRSRELSSEPKAGPGTQGQIGCSKLHTGLSRWGE